MLADAGAAAIERNVYRVAADPSISGRQVKQETLDLVAAVRAASPVPIAVKVGPHWSAFANMATRMAVEPHLVLSDSDELRLPLRWCAIRPRSSVRTTSRRSRRTRASAAAGEAVPVTGLAQPVSVCSAGGVRALGPCHGPCHVRRVACVRT